MSDLCRFLVSVVVYAGTSAVATAIPVLLLPLLTRILSPEDYGLVGMFLIYVNIATALVGLGLNGALSVRYFQQKFNFATYVTACLQLTGLLWVGMSGLYLLLSGLLAPLLKMPGPWMLLAITAAAGNAVLMLRLAIWQAERRPLPFGLTRIAQAGVDVGVSLLLVLALWQGWQGRATAIAAALILIGAVAGVSLWRGGYVLRGFDRAATRDALRFGLPLMPHLLGGMAISFADRFLVSNLLGAETLGIYMVAAQIGLILNLIIVSVNRAFAPWLMRLLVQGNLATNRRIVQVSYLYMGAIAIFVGLTMTASPLLIRLLAAPEFHGAQAVLPWVVLGTGFTAFYYTVTNYLFYANRTGWLSAGTVASAILSLCLSVLLIQANGMVGAGQAFAAGQAITFVVTFVLAQRACPMPWLGGLTRPPAASG
jgi:O-antigen/teichoic acid export membrane protein